MMNPGVIKALVRRCAAAKAVFVADGKTRCPVCDLAGFEHVRSRVTSTKRDDENGVVSRTHQCPVCGLSFPSIEAVDETAGEAVTKRVSGRKSEITEKKESVPGTDRATKRKRNR